MKLSKLTLGIMAFTAVFGLTACGGGGGGGASPSSNNNTTIGAITSFGSIFVNGCEYETDSALITVDGNENASEDNLNVGDIVKINSSEPCDDSTGRGTATSITYADNLEGIVDSNSVSSGSGTLIVLGQNITVNTLTIFEDETGSVASIDAITTGNIVEISGYSIGTGQIVASRIEVKAISINDLPADYTLEIEIKGTIENLDTTAGTFNIGSLIVDYNSVPAIIDDSISSLTNGIYVEVKADSYTPGSPLLSTKVELEDSGEIGQQGEVDDEVELIGLLTAAYDANTSTVSIGSQTFVIDNETEYRDVLLAELTNENVGTLILKGKGKFNNSGILIAREIRLKDSLIDDNECKGTVSNLVSSGLNTGTLTVIAANPIVDTCENLTSLNVTITNGTIMHDSSSVSESKFNLSFLRDGDLVEVHVNPTTGVAIKLERK